jgi:DnaJ-class molecular chaperone
MMDTLPLLEQPCEPCDGKTGRNTCEYCGGTGMVATEAGELILSLIFNNYWRKNPVGGED